MKPCSPSSLLPRSRRFAACLLAVAGWLGLPASLARAAESGTAVLSGTVSNAATGNLLEGARVEVPRQSLAALTDNTGRYVLTGLPAGAHEVVVSYLGLNTQRQTVTVAAGQRAAQNFDLTTEIYQLAEFRVTGEREGGAAAITMQRNADNVKNIVAMDSFGNLPNMSAGELAIRLPGVAGQLDDEGNVTGVIVRGMASTMNRVTVDGGLITNVGGMNRQFQTHSLTGAMFDQLEVIKGHTPDKGADSLGGTVNLRTRSSLSMREKRRVTYNASGRWAPSFTQQIPWRRDHPVHPLINLAYQEVFDVLGAQRNLGVSVNAFYSENVAGYYRTIRDFENTTNQPAYVWDFYTQDGFNNRKQGSLNVKFDYRLSPHSKFALNTIYNDANEPDNRLFETRATTNQTAPNATTSGVIPGYTSRVTQVRPVAASVIDARSTIFSFFNRTRQVDFSGDHTFDRLEIDHSLNYSRTHNNLGGGAGPTLTNRITNVGWILDRTNSDLHPTFTQTAGPDLTNPANYRPNGQLTTRNNDRDVEIRNARANFRYRLPTDYSLFLKAGADWREQLVREVNRQRRWNYTGTTALPNDPTFRTFSAEKGVWNVPIWQPAYLLSGGTPANPAVWNEDRYYALQQRYIGTRQVTETVTAGYLMGQGKVGRLGLLAGVRSEQTDTESWGWVRNRVGSTTAQQQNDPEGSAQRDYANTQRRISGSYTKSFPSAHLTYDIRNDLKARLSWSTSFGRPAMTNLVPNETVNETNQTVTINNPSLLPQAATNWDATLEYYFEPVGNLSVGWFHKEIKDYLVSGQILGSVPSGNDNGFNGEYAGFTMLTTLNAGTAYVQGWEVAYQQQFTFLPGLLKGLALSANYTSLLTHGDFGGTAYRSTNEVTGFVPRTANLSFSWRHRAFSARILYNYTSDYILAFTAATQGRNQYRMKREIVNLGVSYQLNPRLSLTADVSNVFNEPIVQYRGIKDQMERTLIHGTTINFGVSGRF